MLSESSRPYIDASVPVLREHGLAITRRFYANMFAAHPELKNVFNMGNQENGAQQNALASAVLAYAANVGNRAALLPVLDRIAHKHASVGIGPAHYPIVGRHLLGAIKEVLGSAASPELLTAWDEAYWLLAGELIAAEARLYERARVEPGQLRWLKVADVERESDDTKSYYLKTEDGKSPGVFQPGQYISVAVDDAARGVRQLRQYSLSDAPGREHWRITVKAEPASESGPAGSVSNHLHERIHVGDSLFVSAPFGNFTPLTIAAGERPIALLSGGVGITPMLSVLKSLSETRSTRTILFAHAATSGERHAFAEEVRAAAALLPHSKTLTYYENGKDSEALEGRMVLKQDTVAQLRDGDFFMCGPLPFMREQWKSLLALGIEPTRLHREVFGPELLDHLL